MLIVQAVGNFCYLWRRFTLRRLFSERSTIASLREEEVRMQQGAIAALIRVSFFFSEIYENTYEKVQYVI